MTTAFDKISKAKSRLVRFHPFFAHIVLALPLVESDAMWAMATDMQVIYYNPKFVDEHSVSELQGVLAHEALHVCFLHGLREGNRDHRLWNIACDYAINPIVLDAGKADPASGMCLPKKVLYDEKYRDMSAPEIYELLLQDPKMQQQTITLTFNSSGDGSDGAPGEGEEPMWGGFMKATKKNAAGEDVPLSADEMSSLEQEIKITVQQAAEVAKSIGKVPGGMEGLIKAVAAPKINWQDYIQSWIKGITPDDYTWTRPNRTFMANYGIYMPRMQLNGSGTGILSIDTSGSVSDKELIAYINEIVGVIEMCKPDKLIIVQHDAVIQKVDVWEAGMDFSDLKIKGRGGTNIMPTFNYARDKVDEEVNWMICFTDMGIGDWPRNEQDIPAYPVLWAATGPDSAPFGTYIPIKDAMQGL